MKVAEGKKFAPRFYLDSSAYLCILLGEAGSDDLGRRLEGGRLMSSVLLVLEVQRNLIRLSREGAIAPDRLQDCLDRLQADLALFLLSDLTLEICSDRTIPLVSIPRSLDLAHLRTALWFHRREPLSGFVTMDGAQRLAAREMGLPV